MKIVLLILVFILQLNAVQVRHIKWYWDYEKALKVAKKQHKPIMLFLQKKDSKESKKMLFQTLCNQSYVEQINHNFISVVAFFENKSNYPIELFYTNEFPALFFVDYKDESFLIKPIFGYIKSNKFKDLLDKVK